MRKNKRKCPSCGGPKSEVSMQCFKCHWIGMEYAMRPVPTPDPVRDSFEAVILACRGKVQ